MCEREASITRKTKETAIDLSLRLDGNGTGEIHTGVGFFDHMLNAFVIHGGFDLNLKCEGDLEVDCHHTIEDVGIALGTAFEKATQNKYGMARFGSFTIPMDEALASCHVDIGGRPYLVFRAEWNGENVGGMETQMVKEFFYAFAMNSKMTLHINLSYGENDHHSIEAIFKAFAHAMRLAVKTSDNTELLSTKGQVI